MALKRSSWIEIGVPVAAGVVGLATLGIWVASFFAPSGVKPRPFGTEKHVATTNSAPVAAKAAGVTALAEASNVPALPGEWPGFRGPNHDGVATDKTPLLSDPKSAKMLWSVPLGDGYAAPAVKNGRVYLLDYDSQGQSDTLRCFSLADGKELWRNSYPVIVKRNHGMSRTVPATDGKFVVTLGPKCQVLCADAVTGKTAWQIDLVKDYDATVPDWYAGQCPYIDDGKVILATGGKALLVAVDLATGKVAWQSPNPRGWTMTHSSVISMTLGGEKSYLICGSGGVAGVAAKDGKILWDTTDWVVSTATVPTPIPIGDGRIFLCGGYNAGAMMLSVTKSGASYASKTLWKIGSDVFGSDQQTPVLYQGDLYGVVPGGEFVCLGLDGKRKWTSGSRGRFGLGPYIVADGKAFLVNDHGLLTLAEATNSAYKPLGSAQILKGSESWGPLALAGDRLLARDSNSMVCLSLAK